MVLLVLLKTARKPMSGLTGSTALGCVLMQTNPVRKPLKVLLKSSAVRLKSSSIPKV